MLRHAAILAVAIVTSATSASGVTDVSIPFPGVPFSVSYDASSNVAYVSTEVGVFRALVNDPPSPFVSIPEISSSRTPYVRLAPGGSAALRATIDASGGESIEIAQLDAPGPVTIVPPLAWTPVPRPASARQAESTAATLGWRGSAILLYRPANDPSGHAGPWEWTFHDASGTTAELLTTDMEHPFSWGTNGTAVAFRLRRGIEVRNLRGGPAGPSFPVIHTVPGRHRFQSVSGDGNVVVAADADFSSFITVSIAHRRSRYALGAPVHGVKVSPGGDRAVVWLRNGQFVVFRTRSGPPPSRRRLPPSVVNVTSAHVLDDGLTTLSLAERDQAAPSGYAARILQVDGNRTLLDRRYSPARVTRTIPSILHAEAGEVVLRDFDHVLRFGSSAGPGGGP